MYTRVIFSDVLVNVERNEQSHVKSLWFLFGFRMGIVFERFQKISYSVVIVATICEKRADLTNQHQFVEYYYSFYMDIREFQISQCTS